MILRLPIEGVPEPAIESIRVNMAMESGLLALFFKFILLWHENVAFNLDTDVPIVKEGISGDSYFGFSVAQHQILQHTTGGTEHV